MSESDDGEREREAIRERKRERIQREVLGDDEGEAPEPEPADAGSPDEPVHVEGSDHIHSLVDEYDVVLVDFHADWCGPCKMLEPVMETIAADTPAVVAKIDIDEHQHLARDANVRGVPTLLLYADGQPVEQLVGVQDESKLRSLIAEHAG